MRNSTILTPDKNIVQLNPKPAFDMRVGATADSVVVMFSEQVTAAKFTPKEALVFAGMIIKHAGNLIGEHEVPIKVEGNGELTTQAQRTGPIIDKDQHDK